MTPATRQSRRRAFTLLEVLLSVLIFSLIMSSVFTLLNTGTRTLEKTTSRLDALVRARGVVDLLQSDFRGLYFETESDYNVSSRRLLDEMRLAVPAEEAEDLERGRESRRTSERDRDEEVGFLLPPEIDLSFVGSDKDRLDEVSFTVYHPNEPTGFPNPWGMIRVHYFVREGSLYRTEDTIFKENVALDGTIESKPEPEPELISRHVATFDLKYRYWFDGQWLYAPDWDSSAHTYRFPGPSLSAEELGMDPIELYNLQASEPPDDLPSMVVLTLQIGDPRSPARLRTFRKAFRLHNAQETAYTPPYDLESFGGSGSASSASGGSSQGSGGSATSGSDRGRDRDRDDRGRTGRGGSRGGRSRG